MYICAEYVLVSRETHSMYVLTLSFVLVSHLFPSFPHEHHMLTHHLCSCHIISYSILSHIILIPITLSLTHHRFAYPHTPKTRHPRRPRIRLQSSPWPRGAPPPPNSNRSVAKWVINGWKEKAIMRIE